MQFFCVVYCFRFLFLASILIVFDSESLLKSKIICMIELLLYKDVECE